MWRLSRPRSLHAHDLRDRVAVSEVTSMGNLCPAGRLSRTFRSVSRGWFGFFVVDVELRVNAAFPVLLLHAQHLPDQGGLAGVVRKAGVVARLATGIARHLFLVTHRRILLNRLLWSAPGQI